MANQRVSSREFKLMLDAARFEGGEAQLLESASDFWRRVSEVVESFGIDTDGDLDEIEHDKRRTVCFFDSPSLRLRRNGYVFRERRYEASGAREVTLKFRHPDRTLVEDRDMSPAPEAQDDKTKFEEDRKPGQSLFSFSTKQTISHDKKLNRMDDPGRLYPDLAKRLDAYDPGEPIEKVGTSGFREVVVTGAGFHIGRDPKVEASCALVTWCEEPDVARYPAVAEFSFNYNDDLDNPWPRAMGFALLELISEHLEWVDHESKTKTAYAYSLAPPPTV